MFCFCFAVNKQLGDKERVAAALENSHLLELVNQCLAVQQWSIVYNMNVSSSMLVASKIFQHIVLLHEFPVTGEPLNFRSEKENDWGQVNQLNVFVFFFWEQLLLMTSAFEKLNSIYCLCFCSGNVKMSVTAIISLSWLHSNGWSYWYKLWRFCITVTHRLKLFFILKNSCEFQQEMKKWATHSTNPSPITLLLFCHNILTQ